MNREPGSVPGAVLAGFVAEHAGEDGFATLIASPRPKTDRMPKVPNQCDVRSAGKVPLTGALASSPADAPALVGGWASIAHTGLDAIVQPGITLGQRDFAGLPKPLRLSLLPARPQLIRRFVGSAICQK
jgi:hypothetical protein